MGFFYTMKRLTTEEFIKKAKEIHGDRYDYSKVNYITAKTKVCIICPKHGEFWMEPVNHLSGQNCPKCVGGVRLTKEEFITKANEVHNNKYDYSKVDYVNSQTKVCIICPEHGEFWQTPEKHIIRMHGHYLRLDFYLPKYNLAIECQGRQHFEPVNKFGGEERFLENIERDKRKFNLCKIHNIDVLYFTETKRKEYPYPVITNFNDLISMIKKME